MAGVRHANVTAASLQASPAAGTPSFPKCQPPATTREGIAMATLVLANQDQFGDREDRTESFSRRA
jgi:hypothetical protein